MAGSETLPEMMWADNEELTDHTFQGINIQCNFWIEVLWRMKDLSAQDTSCKGLSEE